MNKKFFTLVALLGLFVSFGANAQTTAITSGNYYYLTNGADSALVVTLDAKDKPVVLSTAGFDGTIALGEEALWKVEASKSSNTGFYYYKITNKKYGTVLSFGKSNNKGVGKNVLAGSDMTFTFGTNMLATYAAATDPAGTGTSQPAIFYSYVPDAAKDSVLQLSAFGATTARELFPYKQKGNLGTAGFMKINFVKPDPRYLSAEELNAKEKAGGFQLFGYYNGTAVVANNPLTGIRFTAIDAAAFEAGSEPSATATSVVLEATSLGAKKSKGGMFRDQYAMVDTISYSEVSNLPTDGSRMIFKVDTVPTTITTEKGADEPVNYYVRPLTHFAFLYDPSFENDSVIVRINQTIDPTGAVIVKTAPRTYGITTTAGNPAWLGSDTPTDAWVPVTIDKLAGTSTDKSILTTGAKNGVKNAATRLSFTGDAIPGLLDSDKVYGVKNINKAKGFKNEDWGNLVAGDYYGVDLTNEEAPMAGAYAQVPATQFVYVSGELQNRENELVSLGRIYKAGDNFTNGTDTFEISVLDVDIEDARVGYKYFSTTDVANKGYTFDYMSGILSGRSINVTKDSFVIANDAAGKLFKMIPLLDEEDAVVDHPFGSYNDDVVELARQAYALQTRDGKYTVALNAKGQLVLTGVKSALGVDPQYFFFREIETPGQYIMLPATPEELDAAFGQEYTSKYNVNSTTAIVEEVAVTLANNAFQINDEFAAPYVLDAKGHYTFKTTRGEGLTANANMFATYRKVGELKSEYTEDDFKLYVDTADVFNNPTAPLYYILKGAEAGENSQLQGNFLRVWSDSTSVEGYYVTVEKNQLPRLQFVPAKREFAGDSLLLNYAIEGKHAASDSVNFPGKKYDATKDVNKYSNIKDFRFRIKYSSIDEAYVKLESDYQFAIKNEDETISNISGFVAVLNNVIYLSMDENSAMLVQMNSSDAPTDNAGDNAEAGFQVYGVQGGVIIQGAANQAVLIQNVLGQTIANKTIGSDYETISAGAGFVFVTINGETVKALVK